MSKTAYGHTVLFVNPLIRDTQGPLLSKAVQFGGGSAPRDLNALSRPGIIDTDISGGVENIPVRPVTHHGKPVGPVSTNSSQLSRLGIIDNDGFRRR